jgi:hypothetical protein
MLVGSPSTSRILHPYLLHSYERFPNFKAVYYCLLLSTVSDVGETVTFLFMHAGGRSSVAASPWYRLQP